MLAAGMGTRLAKWTKNNTKCMVEIDGVKLIDRAIEAVKLAGIKKMILVIGYQGQNLKDYILSTHKDDDIEYVFIENSVFKTTNNIYSFFLAKEELFKDDTILLESDLIYEPRIIKEMVEAPEKDIAAIAKYKLWMDGTCVTVDNKMNINAFVEKSEMKNSKITHYYKTVNIYKFSKEYLKNFYLPFLEAYMKAYGFGSYYETTLKMICQLKKGGIKGFDIKDTLWYEIDDGQDLDIATILFSRGSRRYDLLMSKFGGFWRYQNFIDFCYLVNPYFPPKAMVEKMQHEFPTLLGQYPSGLAVQNMNAERLFKVDKEYILVGNGAAELINALGHIFNGTIAVNLPTFNEYVRCFSHSSIIEINNSLNDYALSKKTIKKALDKADCVSIVNPDNPSGFMFDKADIIDIVEYAKEKNKMVIIDESFADFAQSKRRYTLFDNEFITNFPNVVLVKSISKSFGVPGLRLGILASSNQKLLKDLKNDMQIWNINSFAEYYLQIYQLYAETYLHSCDCIAKERARVIKELSDIKSIKIYPSEANYLMIDLGNRSSYDFCIKMLDESNLIIKDLSTKRFFEGRNFIRIAIRDEHDNNILINKFKEVLN